MNPKLRIALEFIVALIVFTAIAKAAGAYAMDEPWTLSLVDFRFPVFWAGIVAWGLHTMRKQKKDKGE